MRRRLILVAAATTLMVALAFLVPLAILVRDLARDRVMAPAERAAQSLALVFAITGDGDLTDQLARSAALGSAGELSVFLSDGRVLGAPPRDDADIPDVDTARAETVAVAGGEQVLVPVVGPRGTAGVVRVFVETADIRRNVGRAWLVLFGLGFVLVGIAVVVADRLGRSVVEPVSELAAAAHRMGEGDLDARVSPDGPPEVVEVGRAFNRLSDRIRALLDAEREAVADLSHRLRTPLTALRLDADQARLSDEVRGRLQDDIDALQRAVDSLIDEARRPVREAEGAVADLAAIAGERVEFWSVLAEEQGRSVEFRGHDPLPVPLAASEVGAIVDTLLGNVFAHTPDGAPLRVSVAATDAGPTLVVEDGGEGFVDGRVLERGVSGSGSTGLGLDIARRAAEAGGGGIELGVSDLGGASVTVRFGPV